MKRRTVFVTMMYPPPWTIPHPLAGPGGFLKHDLPWRVQPWPGLPGPAAWMPWTPGSFWSWLREAGVIRTDPSPQKPLP